MKQEFASLIRQAVTQTILDLSFSSLWDRSKHIALKMNCTLLLSPLPFVLMLFCHSWASVPVLGQLPVDRRQARPLSLPRASLHGHRHPQWAASLHHVSPVPVMSGHFIWTFKCRTAWIGSVCVCVTDVTWLCVFRLPQVHLPLSPSWLDVAALLHTHPCDHHCDTRPALHPQGTRLLCVTAPK